MTEDSRLILLDSHAHLEMEQFDSDREQMIARAREAGVESIVAIGSGTGPGSLDCGIQLAEKYELIYATIGIHPHEAKLATDADFQELGQVARMPKVIAWGEIGLDYFYDHSPRDVQKQVFLKQLERAGAARLPVVIHCRPSDGSDDAWQDCLSLLEQHWRATSLGGILHCFTGAWSYAKRALDLGFMISFAGNFNFSNAPPLLVPSKVGLHSFWVDQHARKYFRHREQDRLAGGLQRHPAGTEGDSHALRSEGLKVEHRARG